MGTVLDSLSGDAGNKRRSIFEMLRSEIRSGKYRTVTRFPSETALARRFGCSRQSVVHAIMSLEDLGLLYRERGSGTYLTKKARKYGASIGIILPGIGSTEIFPIICREISRLAQQDGLNLLLGGDTSGSAEIQAVNAMDLARQFVVQKVSGVFFQPIEFCEKAEEYNRAIISIFQAAKIPVVLIDCDIAVTPERSDFDVVGINNFNAGRKLARHMLECGAKRVRFLRKPLCANTVYRRILGAQTVLRERKPEDFVVTAEAGDEKAIAAAIRGRDGADAFICGNDDVASSLLVTLRKLGKRVPQDILVAGVDDAGRARVVTPSLTTLHQPCEDIARTAFSLLLSRIDNPGLSPRECMFDAPIVVRESTYRAVASAPRKS